MITTVNGASPPSTTGFTTWREPTVDYRLNVTYNVYQYETTCSLQSITAGALVAAFSSTFSAYDLGSPRFPQTFAGSLLLAARQGICESIRAIESAPRRRAKASPSVTASSVPLGSAIDRGVPTRVSLLLPRM
jgi:hypothetical protein